MPATRSRVVSSSTHNPTTPTLDQPEEKVDPTSPSRLEQLAEKQRAKKALKDWIDSLEPHPDPVTKWPNGTKLIYKTEVLNSYKITDKELSTLHYELRANRKNRKHHARQYSLDEIETLLTQKACALGVSLDSFKKNPARPKKSWVKGTYYGPPDGVELYDCVTPPAGEMDEMIEAEMANEGGPWMPESWIGLFHPHYDS